MTHEGTSYTTSDLPLGADQISIDAALAAAFEGLAGADVHLANWSSRSFTVVFGGSLAGQDVVDLEVTLTPTTALPTLAQSQTGETLTIDPVSAHLLVVDYAAQNLVIPTGGARSRSRWPALRAN